MRTFRIVRDGGSFSLSCLAFIIAAAIRVNPTGDYDILSRDGDEAEVIANFTLSEGYKLETDNTDR